MGPSEIIAELKAKSDQQRELIVAAESELKMGVASAKEALNYRASEERKLHPEIVGTAEETLFHCGGALILNQELLDLLNSIRTRLDAYSGNHLPPDSENQPTLDSDNQLTAVLEMNRQ